MVAPDASGREIERGWDGLGNSKERHTFPGASSLGLVNQPWVKRLVGLGADLVWSWWFPMHLGVRCIWA